MNPQRLRYGIGHTVLASTLLLAPSQVIGATSTTSFTPYVESIDIGVASAHPDLWRPSAGVMYEKEPLAVRVVIQRNPSLADCGFEVSVKSQSGLPMATVVPSATNTGVQGLGGNQFLDAVETNGLVYGDYVVSIEPSAKEQNLSPCKLGPEVKPKAFHVFHRANWVSGLSLYGFGVHFDAGTDNGVPNFCDNCNNPFSPSHNSAMLYTNPVIANTVAPTTTCNYVLSFAGANFNGNNGWHSPGVVSVTDGVSGAGVQSPFNRNRVGLPAGTTGALVPGNASNPFWTQWDGDSNTVTVTVDEGPPPSCNILGGKIRKTIHFSDKPLSEVDA